MSDPHDQWTREWPTEPGYYWFWGHRWRLHQEGGTVPPAITFVKVTRSRDDRPVYAADGAFMVRSETGEGFWRRAEIPEPPTKTEELIP